MLHYSDSWQTIFLRELREHGMETTAANYAGVSLRRVKAVMREDEEFAADVADALEAAADVLEQEARRRAVEGVEKGVYYKGTKVDVEQQYSDTLLAMLLKGRRSALYGDKREINLTGNAAVQVVVRQFSRGDDGAIIEATGEATPVSDAELRPLPEPDTTPAMPAISIRTIKKTPEYTVDDFA